MNKNVKRMFFVTALILLLVSISAVSAVDTSNDTSRISQQDVVKEVNVEKISTNDNKIVDTNTKNIKKEATTTDLYVSDTDGSDENSGTSTSPYKTIQKALNQTNSDSIFNIHILEGTYKGLGNTNLTVNGNNTINFIGEGMNKTILDGEVNYTVSDDAGVWGSSYVWHEYLNGTGNWAMSITNGTGHISINNMTIAHMWCPGGDSIYLYEHSPVDNYGNLTVNYVDFYYNCAGVGSAIRNNEHATIIINNSQFELNRKSSSTGNDGIFYNIGDAIVQNTLFDNNYARWGSILNDNKITLINTTFSNNEGYAGSSTYKYGAGFAYNSGGADYFNPGSHQTINEVINCTFINNDQSDIFGFYGPVNVTGNTFINSTGLRFNAGNENHTILIANNTLLGIGSSNITVSLSTGASTYAINAQTGNTTLIIENNTIEMEAGIGIYVNNATIRNNNVSINKQNSTIIMTAANNALITNNNLNQIVNITGNNSLIENNNITCPEEYAISIMGRSSNNTVKDNYLKAHFYLGNSAVKSRSGNTVENNTPTTTGIIYVASNQTEAQSGTMAEPTTLTDALSKVGDNETIILFNGNYTINETININENTTPTTTKTINIFGQDNVTIDGNNNQIFNISTGYNIYFENINFTNANSTTGAAIYSESNISVTNSQFINNTAETGAALYLKGDITVILNQNKFINNTATTETIYFDGVTTKTITDNNYTNNSILTTTIIGINENEDNSISTEEELEIKINSITLTNPEFYDSNITQNKINTYVNDQLNQTLDEGITTYTISSNYPKTLETYVIPTFTTQESNKLTIEVIAHNLPININAQDTTGFIDESVDIVINLTDEIGLPVTKGTVTLTENEETIATINVEEGIATYQTEVLTTTGVRTFNIKYIDTTNTYKDINTSIQLITVDALYASPTVTEKASGLNNDPTTLTDAISRIKDNKTIYLLNGTYTIETPIIINSNTTNAKSFKLYGLGEVIIDGQNITQLMNIDDIEDITINNIIFTKSNQTYGICINNSNITFNNCNFTYCYNLFINNILYSGTIYSNNTNLTITNCIFDHNTNARGNGGAISALNSNLYIQDTYFNNSFSTNQGGAIFIQNTTADINNCIFENITSYWNGGAIAAIRIYTLNINNSKFINTKTNQSNSMGGAIYCDYNYYQYGGTLNVTNSIFNNITSTSVGGAISFNDLNATITNNTFTNVKSPSETFYVTTRGGNITIENNTYTNCTIGLRYNIAINTETPVQVGDEVNFIINVTGLSSPYYYLSSYNSSDEESHNKYLEDAKNLAQTLSAEVSYDIYLNGQYINSTDKNANNFTITSNKSDMSTVYVISSINKTSNTITFESQIDGLLNTIISVNQINSFVDDATFTISVTDRNNTPVTDCGSISIYEDETLIGQANTINGTSIISTNSFAVGNHNLTIYYNDTTSKYNNQTLTTNVFALAKSVYVSNNVTEATEGTIDNPTTIKDALSKVGIDGTIYFLPGVYDLNESILLLCNNNSGYNGQRGPVNNQVKSFTIKGIDEVILTSKTNMIFINPVDGLIVTIENIKIVNSTQYPINTLSNMTINNCSFINNSAVSIYAYKYSQGMVKPEINVTNCLFENNTASAIIWHEFILNVTNSTFRNNHAASGAALSAPQYYADTAISSNNQFINNSALNMGGAVYITAAFNSFNDTFINNTARIGGAVYMTYFTTSPGLNMSNATFIDCSSTGSAGAMYVSEQSITLVNSTFKNIYSPQETLTIRGGSRLKVMENNTYENCSILFNEFTITSPQENHTPNTNDIITINITATLKTPTNYDADILNRTGYQIFINDEKTDDISENEYTFTPENYGTYTIYAYSPLLNTQSNNITINVIQKDIVVEPITATVGQTINITARITVNDETMTDLSKGKVTFKVNGKTLKDANGKVIYAKVVNGTATIENYVVPEDWAKEGTTIQAVYSGSTQCAKLTSEKTNITVTPEETTLTITPLDSVTPGQTTTLTATLSDNTINTGKIVFKINGKTVKDANGKVIYAKVVNGTVSVDYTLPESYKAGNYTVTATFIASGYDRLEASETLTVTA